MSFPKCGTASVGVARQYCGALGKRANCQVAVSVHAATDTASCPLEWELFLPEDGCTTTGGGSGPGYPKRSGMCPRPVWRWGCWTVLPRRA